ncbi:hypothetical protein G3A_17790 [Bacillus sp. 17376]|nr:hypothetical protein G3A_17790 [Bacillus sp. 17376]
MAVLFLDTNITGKKRAEFPVRGIMMEFRGIPFVFRGIKQRFRGIIFLFRGIKHRLRG